MSKVEMSLKEYDEMKEELDFLRRVIKEITTPVIDDWEYDYCMKNYCTCRIASNVSKEVKGYLESQAMTHLPDKITSDSEHPIAPNFENPVIITVDYKDCSQEDSGNE